MVVAVSSPDFAVPAFGIAVRLAVEAGLDAAAIIDGKGKALAVAGALDPDEARALAAHATRSVRAPDLLQRMLDGEMLATSIDDREASIGISAGCVFFVVVFPRERAAMSLVAVDQLRADIEEMVSDAKAATRGGTSRPPPGSPRGSSSGPAELPVVEIGITVPKRESN